MAPNNQIKIFTADDLWQVDEEKIKDMVKESSLFGTSIPVDMKVLDIPYFHVQNRDYKG